MSIEFELELDDHIEIDQDKLDCPLFDKLSKEPVIISIPLEDNKQEKEEVIIRIY
jgi:hypothetical protein